MLAAVAARALFDSKAFCLSRCVCVGGCVCVCKCKYNIYTQIHAHTYTDRDIDMCVYSRAHFRSLGKFDFMAFVTYNFCADEFATTTRTTTSITRTTFWISNYTYNSEYNNSPSLLSVCQLTHCEFNFECVLFIPLGAPWGASTSPHPAAKLTILRCYLRIIRGNWLAKDCQHFGI